ncbi:MAG: hypothetical protein V4632_12260 [Pseudomonadota bacterium]
MASLLPSTLDPESTSLPDRQLGKGHGTDALGPSDSSDTGSDVHGGFGLAQQVGKDLHLGTGTTSDPEESTAGYTEGPDIGDANLDSDTDSSGTGERATADRDTVVSDGQDIDTDHIEWLDPETGMVTDMPPDEEAGARPKRGRR